MLLHCVLLRVTTCYYVLLHVTTCYYVLLRVTTCYYVLLHVTTCYYVLLRVTTCYYMLLHVTTCYYSEPLKSTNLTELCQISLGRRWIRKSNKLTKSKVNPNGTPMYDKLCFGKFCCVKDEETPCGRNSQNIFKVVLNTTKNTHVILGRQWFTTFRLQVITRKAAFTCWIL